MQLISRHASSRKLRLMLIPKGDTETRIHPGCNAAQSIQTSQLSDKFLKLLFQLPSMYIMQFLFSKQHNKCEIDKKSLCMPYLSRCSKEVCTITDIEVTEEPRKLSTTNKSPHSQISCVYKIDPPLSL